MKGAMDNMIFGFAGLRFKKVVREVNGKRRSPAYPIFI